MKRIVWPPKVIKGKGSKERFIDGTSGRANLDGQPTLVSLNRLHANDKSIRGEILNECCNCGFVHLFTFEVICVAKKFYLLKRSHGIKPGRKVRARKK